MKLSLMFFASYENSLEGEDRYGLLIDSAKYADAHGFHSVWVPERHFTPLGSLYPNPAVLQAALARETSRIGLRAGSVVLPLHNPLRVAEEWSVVDNLSGGRVGISVASGWNPDDFAFFPDRYSGRNDELARAVPQLRALWRGEQIPATSGTGKQIRVRSYPRPVQPELPMWMTAASSPESFARAGRMGVNLLTHLLDQGVEGLAERITTYRKARAQAGFDPEAGQVTVMLHTFLGADAGQAIEAARDPYCEYLKGNLGLLKGLASSRGRGDVDIQALPEEEMNQFVHFLYERFAAERSLIGSPESSLPLARRLAAIGVDELACLLDFGPPVDQVMAGLPSLDKLRELTADDPEVLRGIRDRREAVALYAQSPDGTAAGTHEPAAEPAAPAPAWTDDPDEIRQRCTTEIPADEFFEVLGAAGAGYGPRMRCLESLWVGESEVLGTLRMPSGGEADAYEYHPALLDNAFLLLGALAPGALTGGGVLALPAGVGTLRLHRRPEGLVHSHVVRTPEREPQGELRADVRLFDEHGTVAEAAGLRMRTVESAEDSVDPGAALCYRTDWTEVAAPAPAEDAEPGRWLVLADEGGTGEALAAELTAGGHRVEIVRRAEGDEPGQVRRALFTAVRSEPLTGIALLWPLDAPGAADLDTAQVEAAQGPGVESALALLRSALELDDPTRCGRVWLVTRGAQPAGGSPVGVSGVLQSPLWGLGRVAAAEQPDLWGGLLDLDPSAEADPARLVQVLTGERAEDQLAVRGSALLAPRLVRAPELARPASPLPRLDPAGTYLLTGGLGDLGLVLARRMTELGARSLVLTARRGLTTDEQRAAIDELTALGARVHVATADVSRHEELVALRDSLAEQGLPPVVGLVHLAGVVKGAMLGDLDTERLREVTAPKIAGGWNLHRVFADARLFLLVSALPAVFGPVGVGAANYAAANAFLDSLAHHRRAEGSAAGALGYGPWNRVGMAVREDGLDQLARVGVGSMAPAEATEIFDRFLDQDPSQLTVARLNWAEMFAAFPTARHTGQFGAFLAEAGDEGAAELLQRCAEADADERTAIVAEYLTERLAGVLGAEPAQVDRQQPIVEMGLDSLMSLDLRNRIKNELGVVVPMVRLLEGPSIEELTEHVLELLVAVLALEEDEHVEEFTL
ncbi:LLM class flavin-dependent oxidoreductase [Streptomyces sp. NA04227]|uniref:bifunctional LLM class flavin-dependent oxidoreductase/SDR family oxidoreductase n=1 Tax=Streptomyces sp. NA04227 TaxID=2742136 RepID=UPI00159233A5|nr:bifunctional LLM class flavin-dependent oxidoreductase/SDR family oxidoreductase [Streptomyces sp. NA04227]QKW09062.1 LLM class flavin-dependent oxidoreductase [Streptomyces sp. NA04227]